MPFEVRRPDVIDVDDFIASLDTRLRDEIGRTRRFVLPDGLKHPIRAFKTLSRPLLQSGAMVLTALAVIIAVGAAPATVSRTPEEVTAPLAAPTISTDRGVAGVDFADRIPSEDLIAVQMPDIPDTPALTVE
jgi:hypothetical protein